MGITDDNPQIKVITKDLIDLGNSNTKFTRTYVYGESGEFESFFDIDLNGNPYTASANVEKEGAGSTILDLSNLETVTNLVDNGNGTITYTNENGTAVTVSLIAASSDHGTLSGLGDDDHPQYLNESRHDNLPQDNPHNVNKSQVGLGNVDNTSDLDKPISNATQLELFNRLDKRNIGWIFWTSTQSVSYSFGQRNQILFNTNRTTLNPNAPTSGPSTLSNPGSRFFPGTLGEWGDLRLTIDVTAGQGDKQVTLELDISNNATPNVVWSTTIRTPKGGGQTVTYTLAIPYFALSTFIANGGAFYATFDTSGTVANAKLLHIKAGRP